MTSTVCLVRNGINCMFTWTPEKKHPFVWVLPKLPLPLHVVWATFSLLFTPLKSKVSKLICAGISPLQAIWSIFFTLESVKINSDCGFPPNWPCPKERSFFGIPSLTPPSIECKTFQEFHNQYEMASSICLHPVYIFSQSFKKKFTCRTQIVPGQLRQTLVQRPSGRKLWLSNSIDVHRLSIHSTISSKSLKLLLNIKFFTFDINITQFFF